MEDGVCHCQWMGVAEGSEMGCEGKGTKDGQRRDEKRSKEEGEETNL